MLPIENLHNLAKSCFVDGQGLPDVKYRLPTTPMLVKLHWELDDMTYLMKNSPYQKLNTTNFSLANPAPHAHLAL